MIKKPRYLTLIIVLLISIVFVSGCGVDTATLAGNASISDDSDKNTVEVVESDSAEALYDETAFLLTVPEWDGDRPYCIINNNRPDFSEDEIWTATQESLDNLDDLGRCGTANSCIGKDGMPDQSRGNISEIHPTGWHSDSYEFVEGGNLYNRCHLIAFELSGDDAVARNLITGTSYMNRKGMLPFENQIEQYVTSTGNHVMYRVTPCFAGKELVSRGVHLQAISVEDGGEGLSFNVFCYNVQPGIEIDYATGDSKPDGTIAESTETNTEEAQTKVDGDAPEENQLAETHAYVLNTNTKVFHYPYCSSVKKMKDKNRRDVEDNRDSIEAMGFKPCGNCHP